MANELPSSLPEHRAPQNRVRAACAPYNFVPLPDRVICPVADAKSLPKHDTYADTDYPHTGYFDVTLTTRSPLYIRGLLTREQFDRQERGESTDGFAESVKNTPDFFSIRSRDCPVIPGSSLRGMLRAVLEIVSYGKVQPVTERQLFFRSFDGSVLSNHYRERMTEVDPQRASRGRPRVQGGFLSWRGERAVIMPCTVLRVRRDTIRAALHQSPPASPSEGPSWSLQHRPIWVRAEPGERYVDDLSPAPRSSYLEGRLVVSGWAPTKRGADGRRREKGEFVFLLPDQLEKTVEVPEQLIRRFEDDDQITQWQQNAFPHDKPREGSRPRDGWLERRPEPPGDPVFFLRENGVLSFFGRAQMFRLPYWHSPSSLVSATLGRTEDVDYAEAIFGYIRRNTSPVQGEHIEQARAGRVFVTDAVWDGSVPSGRDQVWLSDAPIIPKILASPKPTAFQHYLVQTTDDKKQLAHYDKPFPETTLRGFKRYWHQGSRREADLAADPRPPRNSTQHTRFRPVSAGVGFTFRIYFENLSDRELGALCWALQPLGMPDHEYCHSLGMGKPLGMGAVSLDATLHLTDRCDRYAALFDGNDWRTGETQAPQRLRDRVVLDRLTQPFERHVLAELGTDVHHLYDVPRIQMLLAMMEWPGVPPVPAPADRVQNSRTMNLEEFKERPVLPDPLSVVSGSLPREREPYRTGTRVGPPGGPDRHRQRPAVRREAVTSRDRTGEPPRRISPSAVSFDQSGRDTSPPVEPTAEQSVTKAKQARRGKPMAATVLSTDPDRLRVRMRLHTRLGEEVWCQWQWGRALPETGSVVTVKVQSMVGDRVTDVRPM